MTPEIGLKMNVKGVAIKAGVSRNQIKYTDKELQEGCKTLKGVTIIKDHEALTDNSVGMVTSQTYEGKTQYFSGWVEEDGTNLLSKIKDKRVKVSVGAIVEKLVREDEDSDIMTAKGIRYMELSLTPTPGIPAAEIEAEEGVECDVTESIDLKKALKLPVEEKEVQNIVDSIMEKMVVESASNTDNTSEVKEMGEETKQETPTAEVPEPQPVPEEPKKDEVKEEPKAEEPAPEPEAVPEVKTEEPAKEPEGGDVGEAIKQLATENAKLKIELQEKENKLKEAEKMAEQEIVETKSKMDVEEKASNFDGYVIEKSEKGMAFFKMPNESGIYK